MSSKIKMTALCDFPYPGVGNIKEGDTFSPRVDTEADKLEAMGRAEREGGSPKPKPAPKAPPKAEAPPSKTLSVQTKEDGMDTTERSAPDADNGDEA